MLGERNFLKSDQKSRSKNKRNVLYLVTVLLGKEIQLVGKKKKSLGLRRQQHERNTFLLSEKLEGEG